MGEGQGPIVAWRTRFRGAHTDTLETSLQATEIIHEPRQSGGRELHVSFPLAIRARFRRTKWRAAFRRAVEDEQAFGHVFLFAPVFLGLGALTWFSLAQTPGFLETALLMCIFGMAAFLLRPGLRRNAALLLSLFLGGMVLAAGETARKDTVLLDTPVTTVVRGTVTARETTDRGYWRYSVNVIQTSHPALKRPPATVTLLSRSRAAPVEIGGGIEGKARLSPPSGPALPGLNDFAFDSYFKGVGAVGYFYGNPVAVAAVPEKTARGPIATWPVRAQEAIARMRETVGARIRSTIGGDAGAIAAALVTAEERAISRPTIEALREAGLAHVLAISGLNMVLAAGTFLIGARTLLSLIPGLAHRFPIKKLAAAGALIMVFVYILISGGAVSAVRSWIMISIMLVAVFFDRPSISLRNVALSALIILLITPSAVTGPGFQMSFAATLALVAGYGHWRERPGRETASGSRARRFRAVGGFFAGLLLSSFIGGLSTMIYSAGHFHRLAAYGLVGNILAMPVISVLVMPFALLAMLLMPFGLDRYPLLVMGQGLDWVISIANVVSSWGGEVTTGRVPHSAFMLIAIGGILACLLRTRLALSGMVVIAAGLLAGWGGTNPRPDLVIAEDGRLVAMIEQGEAASNRTKPADFVFSQWQRALRLDGHQKPQQRADLALKDADAPRRERAGTGERPKKPLIDKDAARSAVRRLLAETAPGRFACAPEQWCAATARAGWRIVTVEDARLVGVACDEADIIVTALMLRFQDCRSGAMLLSGQSLRRTGAVEIFAVAADKADQQNGKGAMRVVTALDQLERPWGRHRTYDWRTGEFNAP